MRRYCRRCIPLISHYSNKPPELTRNKALGMTLDRPKVFKSFFLTIGTTPNDPKKSSSASLVNVYDYYRLNNPVSPIPAPPVASHNTNSGLRPKVSHLPDLGYLPV